MAQANDRGDAEATRETGEDEADRVLVSYPADFSEWGRFQVDQPSFRAWLRKTHDAVEEGDVWEEFVDVGCCGSTLDVPLRVEGIEGGSRLGEDTEIEYTVREACGIEGSWRVQSEGGPSGA